ncbi:MAG: O-antigen ligase family protein [Thermomonas haemolytica]
MAALPFTSTLPAFAAALLLTGLLRPRRILRSRRMAAIALAVLVLAVVGIRAGIGWMGVDALDEMRHTMATAALAIGRAEAPLGSGVGSFVPAFEQASPLSLRLPNYINHAHNEFAQWWMTSGWLGMLALAAVVVLLLAVGWRILCSEGRQAVLAAACWVALVAVLAHSWVDYPLRTLTLMATCGALAGVMLAVVGDAHARLRGRSQAVAPVAAEAGATAEA